MDKRGIMATVIHCDRCDSVISVEGELHIIGGLGINATSEHTKRQSRHTELCEECFSLLKLWLRGPESMRREEASL